jgi:hypothetical protein
VSCKPPHADDLLVFLLPDDGPYPLVHYACFWCGAFFSAPAFDNPSPSAMSAVMTAVTPLASFAPWTSRFSDRRAPASS